MPRALSVARATVKEESQTAYLALARRLADALHARGQHLWLFQHPSEPGTFLEFREGDAATHPLRAPTIEESRLTAELRGLAAYEAAATELWIEVPLGVTHEEP
jgi:hypothetical protein